MRNRRRNWFIKRIALGFAVAAFVAPVAQAKVDEGIQGQLNTASENVKPIPYRWPSSADKLIKSSGVGWPGVNPSDYALTRGDQIEVVRVEQPRSTGSDIVAADYGMPRAMPHDYALTSGDQIEVVRAEPRGTSSDEIEFVRTQPRSTAPALVASRFGRPNATTSTELEALNWNDAGIGAGFALLLVLLGGGAVLATRHMGRAQTA